MNGLVIDLVIVLVIVLVNGFTSYFTRLCKANGLPIAQDGEQPSETPWTDELPSGYVLQNLVTRQRKDSLGDLRMQASHDPPSAKPVAPPYHRVIQYPPIQLQFNSL